MDSRVRRLVAGVQDGELGPEAARVALMRGAVGEGLPGDEVGDLARGLELDQVAEGGGHVARGEDAEPEAAGDVEAVDGVAGGGAGVEIRRLPAERPRDGAVDGVDVQHD